MAPSTFVGVGVLFSMFAATATAAFKCPDRGSWVGQESQTREYSITVIGQQRSYLMHIPQDFTKHDGKAGFIFSFHDEQKDAWHQEGLTGFSDPAYNPNYIAIYPQALNGIWHPGRSSGGAYDDPSTTNPQDHIFTSAILDELYTMRGLCPDEKQVYATGFGNGSAFVHHLNCRNVHTPPFAAFAGVAGTPQTFNKARCHGPGVRPLMSLSKDVVDASSMIMQFFANQFCPPDIGCNSAASQYKPEVWLLCLILLVFFWVLGSTPGY